MTRRAARNGSIVAAIITTHSLDDDLHTAAKASGVPLAELVRCGLATSTAPRASPGSGRSSLGTLDDGEPSPGVLCAGPGCFQRDTRKYGSASSPSAQPAPQP